MVIENITRTNQKGSKTMFSKLQMKILTGMIHHYLKNYKKVGKSSSALSFMVRSLGEAGKPLVQEFKKTTAYAEEQNNDQLMTYSKYLSKYEPALDSSDNEGTSSVTRAYNKSENDRVSILNQVKVNSNATEFIHDDKNDAFNEFVNKFLSSQQSQQISLKDYLSKPSESKKIVAILEKKFTVRA